MSQKNNDALDALRVELKQNTIEPELVDYVIDRTVEVVGDRQRQEIATLGGSPKLAAVWGTAALFYVHAARQAGDGTANAAYRLAVLAGREALAYFAHMDRACERSGSAPYALRTGQIAQHLAQARAAMGWLKEAKQAENRPLDTESAT